VWKRGNRFRLSGLELRTVRFVASRYIDYAILTLINYDTHVTVTIIAVGINA